MVGTGRKLYEEGAPEANIPACVACHGPGAEGAGAAPRLAGQLWRYTNKQLKNWTRDRGDGNGSEAGVIMREIAAGMTKAQIEAVAAYLNSLR